MAWVRLRQVALVAVDLEEVVGELGTTLGLEVGHCDPAVAAFGLRNAVLPLGHQFVEVVSPTREGTAAGRQLARAGGDGGYMVICQTDDGPGRRRRAAALGVRTAFEADEDGYSILQWHPADTGGSFLELDVQPGGEDPWGPWAPAGPRWQEAVRTDRVDAITGVVVQSVDPDRTAARWASLLATPTPAPTGQGGWTIPLDNATVTVQRGPTDALVQVAVRGAAPPPPRRIAGVLFRPA
jgi:hypothetical protein